MSEISNDDGTVFRYDGKEWFMRKVRCVQSNGESFDSAIR